MSKNTSLFFLLCYYCTFFYLLWSRTSIYDSFVSFVALVVLFFSFFNPSTVPYAGIFFIVFSMGLLGSNRSTAKLFTSFSPHHASCTTKLHTPSPTTGFAVAATSFLTPAVPSLLVFGKIYIRFVTFIFAMSLPGDSFSRKQVSYADTLCILLLRLYHTLFSTLEYCRRQHLSSSQRSHS